MRDLVVVLGAACFFAAALLFGDFLVSPFLPSDSAGYWFIKFLNFLGISLILLGCVIVLFRKCILNAFISVINKLAAIDDLKKIGPGLVQNWDDFLLVFYKSIETRAMKAVDVERELLDVRRQYDSILNAQAEFVFGLDEWGSITYHNKSFGTFMQLEEGDLGGGLLQSSYEIDSNVALIIDSCDKSCLNEAKKSPSGYQFIGAVGKGADIHHIDWVVTYIPSGDVNKLEGGYLFVGRDITVEYLAGKKNKRLETLAATGKIVHFIAHEINQPISTIRLACSNLELAIEGGCGGCAKSERLSSKVTNITAQIERIGKIIDTLKVFGRDAEPQEFEINAELNPVFDGYELSGIDFLDIRLDPAYYPVMLRGSKFLFQQIILNIINNAIYAVEKNSIGAPKVLIVTEVKPHEKVVAISISDNGGGVPPEELGFLSDIFHTTKPLGKGSGIGLALCLSVVEKMGGELILRNILGGFNVTLVFPFSVVEGDRHSE